MDRGAPGGHAQQAARRVLSAGLRDRLRVGDEDVLDVVDETCERFHGLWADGAADRMPPPVAEWIGGRLEDTLNRLRGES